MKNIVPGILKVISILLFDAITLLVVVSVWAIVNIPLFPLALISILFSLFILNLIVLFSGRAIQLFGIGSFVSTLIVSVLYYIFIMAFTWVSYAFIQPKWYLIAVLIATLSNFSIITGLYVAGSKKSEDLTNQKIQSDITTNTKIQLLNIKNELLYFQNIIGESSCNSALTTYAEMEERFMSSTPFGRKNEPMIIGLEQQISHSLKTIADELALLKNLNSDAIDLWEIKERMAEVKNQILNREKLIVK